METKNTRPLSELKPLLENEDIRYKAAQEIARPTAKRRFASC